MAKERLSKFQKWVLVHTYLKTVKKKLPSGWRPPQINQFSVKHRKKHLKEFSQALFKTEILANYFKLNFVEVKYFEWGGVKWPEFRYPWSSFFRSTGKDKKPHNKAMVSCSRSFTNLTTKGLINWGPTEDRITLTEVGKAKAKEIIEREQKPAA